MLGELTIKEKLALSSLYERNGNNWALISRMIKQFCEPGRPSEWLNPIHCAQQFDLLNSLIDIKRRKKAGENIKKEQEILKVLTDKRQEELMNLIEEETNRYLDIYILENDQLDFKQLQEMLKEMELHENGADSSIYKLETDKATNLVLTGEEVEDEEEDINMSENILNALNKVEQDFEKQIQKIPHGLKIDVNKNESLVEYQEEVKIVITDDLQMAHTLSPKDIPLNKTMTNELEVGYELATTSETPRISSNSMENVGKDGTVIETSGLEDISSSTTPVTKQTESASSSRPGSSLDHVVVKTELLLDDDTELTDLKSETGSSIAAQRPSQDVVTYKDNPRKLTQFFSNESELKLIQKFMDVIMPYTLDLKIKRKPNKLSISASANNNNHSKQQLLNTNKSSLPPPLVFDTTRCQPGTPEHKVWKRSIMLLHARLCSHNWSDNFFHPITDSIAPFYSSIVHYPVDLGTLKKWVENGTVRSTNEYRRWVEIMFQNALMYNSEDHLIYKMTQETYSDALKNVNEYLAAASSTTPSSIVKVPPGTPPNTAPKHLSSHQTKDERTNTPSGPSTRHVSTRRNN